LAGIEFFYGDSAGYECGIGIDGFDDIKVGDQLEVIEMVEIARKA